MPVPLARCADPFALGFARAGRGRRWGCRLNSKPWHESSMLSGEPARSTDNHTPPLITGSSLGRLAGIGVVILGVAAAFLYLGGWFSPHALTPARFVDGFERVNGIHSGFRRNHAKGVSVSGFFESNGQGMRLSKAVVFRPGRMSVIGRFS